MPFYLERFESAQEQTLCEIGQRLSSLTIGCKDDDDPDGIFEASSLWTAFFASTVNLQHLKIHLGTASHPSGWQMPGYRSVVQHALARDCMPKLQVFELVGQTDKPGLIHARELQYFLLNHRATLRDVKLSGVLFMLPDRTDGALGRIMTDLLNWVRANFRLTTFTMSVYRRDEHSNGGCIPRSCDKSRCESYRMNLLHDVHRSELESLAGDLDVPLRGGVWDFGEYAMR